MKATIFPGRCQGSIKIPPSKSMAHRAILCAALSNDTSLIHNVAYSDDITATLNAIKTLGAKVEVNGDTLKITGIKNIFERDKVDIDCIESGSTLRFLIPILALSPKPAQLFGQGRLLQRPQQIYEDIFKKQQLTYLNNQESILIKGPLHSDTFIIDGSISSQFISGLLFALPLLPNDSQIIINEPYESKSYVDLTLKMMRQFGIKINVDPDKITIGGNQQYQASEYTIEGDYSQAAFFAVLAAINAPLTLTGLDLNSLQGDKAIMDILKSFNADITLGTNCYTIGSQHLKPELINLENCPDLGPILNVLMMYTPGTSKIINAARLRYKESDRIAAMQEELRKCGVDFKSNENSITINGAKAYQSPSSLFSHHDHRIVMSEAIAATLFDTPVTLTDAQCINKSYPNFFTDLQKVGIKVVISDE